jgi:AcrR family transcriptional regulator
MAADARRRQIVEVTLGIIARHGLQGVTMARIAAGAGVRQSTLYAHFESREAILHASLDSVYQKIDSSHETAGTDNTLERLREMCDRHLDLWADQGEGRHAPLLLEFIAGTPDEGLRGTLAARHLHSVQRFAYVVAEGQREGKIPAGVDPEQVAWMIIGWAFAGDVCHLMGFKPFHDPKTASHWLNVIFDSFAKDTESAARAVVG